MSGIFAARCRERCGSRRACGLGDSGNLLAGEYASRSSLSGALKQLGGSGEGDCSHGERHPLEGDIALRVA